MIRHFKLCCWKVGRKVEDEEVKKKIEDGTSKSETYLIVFFSGQTTEALRARYNYIFFLVIHCLSLIKIIFSPVLMICNLVGEKL